MKYTSETIRNIALIGHSGEGKTTLAEAMLYRAGVISRMGNIADSNTVMDFDEEEMRKKSSISLAIASLLWKDSHDQECKINIIDVPGELDFAGELSSALEIAGAAVVVASACGHVTVGAQRAIDELTDRKIPGIIFINQVDKENYNFSKTYQAFREAYPGKIAIVSAPMVVDDIVIGFLNVFEKKGYDLDGKEIAIPEYLVDKVDMFYTQLAELAAESDEALLDKYLSGGSLSIEEITKGIKKRQVDDGIMLVMGGSGIYKKGVPELMDFILQCMRKPSELPPKAAFNEKGEPYDVYLKDSQPLSVQIFKTIVDPYVGKLSLFKVTSGVLKSGQSVYNANVEKEEKIGTLYQLNGKKQTAVDELSAGDIGAVAKLQYTKTGHTLSLATNVIRFPDIKFPKPMLSLAVHANKKDDEEKIIGAFIKLEEEDATFKIKKNEETGEMLIKGLGEVHLDVLCKKLSSKFKLEAKLMSPKIAYRETIRVKAEGEGKHRKQSGGSGEYGHVKIRFEPCAEDFIFATEVVGGAVPKNYFGAVEKGLIDSAKNGILAGYPLIGLKATLYDGSYHEVDSKDIAFQRAANLAFKDGIPKAKPVLLEPIQKVMIKVPAIYLGDVLGDINKKRGRVGNIESTSKGELLYADIPLSEMAKYATELKSITQGRGYYEMEFARYDEVPEHIALKIIEERKA